MINLIYNGIAILISEKQVLSRINIEYQHIIIMHIDNRYKWKPIREKTTSYYCCDAKASSNSLSPLIFCRPQSTGGYYLNSASYNLQRSSNSHLFSTGYNLHEAPTSASYNCHLSSYNLIWKHQLPHITIKSYVDLPGYQLCFPPSSLLSSSFNICLISSMNLHSFSICSSFFLPSLSHFSIL